MPTKIFILVFRGEPLDYPQYRHTALFFQFPDGEETTLHVTGAHGFFEFEDNPEYDPRQSRKLVRTIPVTQVPDSIDPVSIRGVVSRTLIRNGPGDADWNCQNWVGDALDRLVSNGCFSAEQKSAALDEMVDACLEAEDHE